MFPSPLPTSGIETKPGECPLDDPLAGQKLEALCGIGSLDDFEGPFAQPQR